LFPIYHLSSQNLSVFLSFRSSNIFCLLILSRIPSFLCSTFFLPSLPFYSSSSFSPVIP
jgi:hypothetical protein